MVRAVDLSGMLDHVDFQKAFGILFGDEKFQKRYHKEVSKDPAAVVTKWSKEGRREVRFAAPVTAPKVVQMLLGADKLQVKEIQEYTKLEDSIIISSEPIFDTPGGSSFRTFGKVTLAPAENGTSCLISMHITLECNTSVWGVQGTVEGYMESHARKSFLSWLRIARIFCQEELGLAQRPSFEEEEEYFDFEENVASSSTMGRANSSSSSSSSSRISLDREMEAAEAGSSGGIDMWFVQSIMKELNGLQISGNASKTHLEKLNVKLQRIEDELKIVKSHLERKNGLWSHTSWGFVALGFALGLILGMRHLYFIRSRK